MKDGLVAPVWSEGGVAGDPGIQPGEVPAVVAPAAVWRDSGEVTTWEVTADMLAQIFGQVQAVKAADPNAKPAIPALTRVGGNKRGPGWCDE